MHNNARAAGPVAVFKRNAMALAIATCFGTGAVWANPTNPVVVNGAASFAQNGNLLSVTNSPNAIINWGSFSIGVGEITRFIQQSNASAVLNRVVGQDPSAILGALHSNGRVFLINPNGIVFGAGSQIDVGGLVASTLNLSNADFLAGRLRFTDGLGNSIINNGSITTPSGGSVYLIGNAVTNNGIITSPKGEVVLAAGNSVELVNPGTPNLRVEITAPDNQAVNLGTITAEAGRIGIYAGLINHSGTINANSVEVDQHGQILLKATTNTTLETGSTTTANGPTGGSITVQSGDTTLVSGTVSATGTAGKGGNITVLGDRVGLLSNASLNASGEAGGGTVLVGGDLQGKNPDIQNAFRTYVSPDTTIKADALTNGDGGRVIVWADDVTRYYGSISAKGGANSGNGGFVEVSGKQYLDFNGMVNTSASSGATGTLLLDPADITISNNPSDSLGGGCFSGDVLCPGILGSIFANADSGAADITWATISGLLSSSNVKISTYTASGTGSGNITISDNSPDLASSFGLTLYAQNNVTVNGSITNSGGGFLSLIAGWAGNPADLTSPAFGTTPGVGSVIVNQPISFKGALQFTAGLDVRVNSNLAAGSSLQAQASNNVIVDGGANISAYSGTGALQVTFVANQDNAGSGGIMIGNADQRSTIDSNGGNIVLGGLGSNPAIGNGNTQDAGVFINTATLNAGGGSITIRGQGANSGSNGSNYGVYIWGASGFESFITTTSGGITIQGTGGSGDTLAYSGVRLEGISKISSVSGPIALTGTGGVHPTGSSNGIEMLSGALIESTGSATISLNGTAGGNTASGDTGVLISDAGTKITSSGGNIQITGQGGSSASTSDSNNYGIFVDAGAIIEASGLASISLNGTGGSTAAGDNVGIRVAGSATRVQSTGGGNITLTGQGGAGTNNNNGIRIDSAVVSSSGTLTLDGTGAGTGGDNSGIKLSGSGATLQSTGLLSLTGQGGLGASDNNDGIRLESGSLVESAGAVVLDGTGGTGGADTVGVKIGSATVRSTGSGTLTLTGRGGTGTDNNNGVRLESGALVSTAGSIVVNGTGAGTGDNNSGIKIGGATIQSTGSGSITLTGTAGAGINNNDGVRLESSAIISANSGAISITGTGAGSGANNFGVNISSGSITSAGSTSTTIIGSSAGAAAGLIFSSGTTVGGASHTGDLLLKAHTAAGADSIGLAGVVSGAGRVVLEPINTTTSIGVAGGAGTFNLSIADLNTLQNGFSEIVIGRSDGTGQLQFGGPYTFNDSVMLMGGQLLINGALTVNGGNLMLRHGTGGNVSIGGNINVGVGQIDAAGQTVLFTGAPTITSSAASGFSAGTLIVDGTDNVILNANTTAIGLDVSGGTLGGSGGLTLNGPLNYTGGSINLGGTLKLSSSSSLAISGQTLSVGTLDLAGGSLGGTGTVNGNVNNDGIVSPGTSPGILTITGNYVQGPTGVLNVDISGTTPGTQYDQLQIGGTATLRWDPLESTCRHASLSIL